jgi:hypothetical protein
MGWSSRIIPDGDGIAFADRAADLGMNTAILTGYAFHITPKTAARHEVWMKPMRPVELVARRSSAASARMSAAHPIDARRLLRRVIYQGLREDKSARRFGDPPLVNTIGSASIPKGMQPAGGRA